MTAPPLEKGGAVFLIKLLCMLIGIIIIAFNQIYPQMLVKFFIKYPYRAFIGS